MFTVDTLRNKVILVTGGGSGLGLSMAKRFAELGADVAICGRTEEKLQRAAKEIEVFGHRVLTHVVDVRDYDGVGKMVERIVSELGVLDGLVNNAAQSKIAPHADLEALTADDFINIFSVNVIGAYQMVRAVTPQMKQQGKGAIVNISSLSAITGSGSSIAYAVSKGALNTMTMSLARALAPEIRVNAVCPGLLDTSRNEMVGRGEAWQRLVAQVPLGRAGTPGDVAGLIAFLCTGAASYIHGQCINVDGGSVMEH